MLSFERSHRREREIEYEQVKPVRDVVSAGILGGESFDRFSLVLLHCSTSGATVIIHVKKTDFDANRSPSVPLP
jgi:hypothetical protein